MTLEELAVEYWAALPGLVLTEEQTIAKAIEAARFYAGYGDIRSLTKADTLPEAPGADGTYPAPQEPAPAELAALPVKRLELIDGDTVVSTGEWAIIRPLFVLYVERGNATLLEATRGLGADVFGRTVSEVATDIKDMEDNILPGKSFVTTILTIGGDENPSQQPGGWGFFPYPGSWTGG